jgi:hypothetical protein
MNIIILTSQSFNLYFENRMQLSRLADEGFEVKVFDLSLIMMRDAVRSGYSPKDKRVAIFNIKNRKSLKLMLKKYKKKVVVIDYANQDSLIRHMINKLNIKIIRIQGGGVPTTYPANSDMDRSINHISLSHFCLKFNNLLNAPPAYLFNALKRKFFLRIYKPYIDTLILAGDGLLKNEQMYINSNTKVIKAHNFDFDIFKSVESNGEQFEDNLVFIDAMVTSHPDLTMQNLRYKNPEIYFERLRHFFDKVEDVTNLKVVIALHPRNYSALNSSDFGDRGVFLGRTADLIKKSRGIITHHSNSVNFAILFNKPILFIADKDLISLIPEMIIMHKWFNQKPIMIDSELNSSDIYNNMMIDIKTREEYSKNFIICNDTNKDMTLIDLLIHELKGL